MAEWYEALYLTDVAKHSTFVDEPFPTGAAIIPETPCKACSKKSTAGHETCAGVSLSQVVPTTSRLSYASLRCIHHWLSDLNRFAAALHGSTPNFRLNCAGGTRNFADYTSFNVVSVSGSTVVVAPASGDARCSMPLSSCPQPGDLLVPALPSCLYGKVECRVLQVTLTETQATLVCDQDLSNLMTTGVAHALQPAPTTYTVSLLRAASEPELFPPVVEPTWMRCQHKSMTVSPVADNIVLTRTNNTNGTIAWPTEDTLVVKTYYDGDWHTITPDCLNRIYVQKDGAGFKTTLCLGSTDVNGNALTDLLVNGETAVSVTYYPQAAGSATAGVAMCCDRCKHCIRDYSNSAWGAPDGVAVDANSHTWYCDVRRYYDVDHEIWKSPTGIADFNPRCALYGTCDQFDALDEDTYFSVKKNLSPWLRSITSAANIRQRQIIPNVASYRNWILARVGHPSLMSLYGGPFLASAVGPGHETTVAIQWGAGYVGSDATVTDGSGNTTLAPLYGALVDYSWLLSGEDYESAPGNVPDGCIPTLVSGWSTRKDALGETYTEVNDPYNWDARHFHRMSPRVKRDTLELQTSKGPALWPRAFANIPVIIPAIDLTIKDSWQTHANGRAKVLTTPISIGGTDYSLLIEFTAKRQDDKSEQTITTGTVASVEPMEDGTCAIQVENVLQTSSFQDINIPGCDCLIKWMGGGRFVQAPDYMKIPSFWHEDKSIGGLGDLTSIGDSVKFSGITLPSQPLFTDRHFTVVRAQAFGGTAAEGWGPKIIARAFTVGGYWQPVDGMDMGDGYEGSVAASTGEVAGAYDDTVTAISCAASVAFCIDAIIKCTRTSEIMLVTSNDDAGNITVTRGYASSTPAALVNGDELVLQMVTDSITNIPYTISTATTRPALTSGHVWVDPVTSRFHFADADQDAVVDICYWVEQLTQVAAHCYRSTAQTIAETVQDHYTSTRPFLDTGISDAETITTVTLDGVELTYTAGTPSATQYTTDSDSNSDIVLLFSFANSGKAGSVSVVTTDEAPSPGDVSYLPEYGTGSCWGKYQDMITVMDEDGELAVANSNLIGATITSYRCATAGIPTGNDPLAVAELGETTFSELPSGSYLWLVGSGKAYVTTEHVTTLLATGNLWCVKG